MEQKNNCVELTEIFGTEHGSVYQCNKTNCYILEYSGKTCSFKPANFLDFVKQLLNIDLESLIFSKSAVTDVLVLMPPYCNRSFVLTLTDILQLRELVCGAKFNLYLYSTLNTCLPQSLSV
ncbi:MAG: hypothetical protein H7Y07_06025 [Pyrinomonadaceae bacterium]|nr:hypothetical protein [Sphingobacteriaceae bacterium]